MKITFLCDSLKVGGPQRVMVALANELVQMGHEINIYTVKNSDCDYELNEKVKHVYDKTFSSVRIIRLAQKFIWYRHFLKNVNSDCIISFYYTINMNLMLWKLFGAKNKIIISERNDPNNEPQNIFLRRTRNFLYRYADGIVYQTEDAQKYYSKCEHIPHTIIPNPMREDLPERFEGIRKREIVNFCRITEQKNLKLLIDSFRIIQKDYQDLYLKIYGEGNLKEELKKYVRGLNMESRIHILDSTPRVHEYTRDSLMFVSTSDYEGISNSMMEALGMGLPTICTDCPVGGARLMIENGKNGLLVPTNNQEEVIKAVKYYLDNPVIAEQMGKNAYLQAKELNVQNIALKWEEFTEVVFRRDV